jgi:hypothetical protein
MLSIRGGHGGPPLQDFFLQLSRKPVNEGPPVLLFLPHQTFTAASESEPEINIISPPA